MKPVSLIAKAFNFAAQKHSSQRRKGAAAEPYINHLAEVASLIAENTDGDDVTAVVVGILHDTIEDTKTTYDELVTEFGTTIADIVMETTDDKSLPKAERKLLQIEHAGHASDTAKTVKMADKISNLRAILTSPPPDWADKRKLEYFVWAKAVVDQCRSANTGLATTFDKVYAQGITAFTPKV